jgi:hypothetical protein
VEDEEEEGIIPNDALLDETEYNSDKDNGSLEKPSPKKER